MKKLFFMVLVVFVGSIALNAQPRQQFSGVSNAKLATIPNFVLPDIYKDRNTHPLPAMVDNSAKKYMPPYSTWCIQGWSCANATAMYCFNYEINRVRDAASTGTMPQYPYLFTYEFLNSANVAEGGDGWMFVDAFDIFKETGCPSSADCGGFEWGYQFCGWMSGYAKYYNAMKNKVEEYYKIDASADASVELIKQYLYDHADGSAAGGILCFQANSENMTTTVVPAISAQAGKPMFSKLGGGGGHSMNIVGYDDNVGYDYNGDGKLTNPGTDISQWEKGSWIICNNWGDGIYYAPYRLFSGKASGGLATSQGTPLMFCKIKKDYSPLLTFKISITHNQRNGIQLITGIATSAAATAPAKTKNYSAAFNFCGGALPMCGKNQSSTIEIGLDLSDFVKDIIGKEARFFLQVTSKGGTGQVNGLSLIDYSGAAMKETQCLETNKAIPSGATTSMSIPWTGSIPSAVHPFAGPMARTCLLSAFPNPVKRSSGQVLFSAQKNPGAVSALRITDVRGCAVRTILFQGSGTDFGNAEIPWNLKDGSGKTVSAGIYIVNAEFKDGKISTAVPITVTE
jgi:hypothetical protein